MSRVYHFHGGINPGFFGGRIATEGGVFAMVAPPNPYRCPPGPYERISMVAWHLKNNNPTAKILVLDPKENFSKQGLFQEGWNTHYAGMIERIGPDFGGANVSVDPDAMTVDIDGDVQSVDVCNVIPAQKAGAICDAAGLTDGRWAPVLPDTMQSRMDENVYILGDSTMQGDMPKSGFSANSQDLRGDGREDCQGRRLHFANRRRCRHPQGHLRGITGLVCRHHRRHVRITTRGGALRGPACFERKGPPMFRATLLAATLAATPVLAQEAITYPFDGSFDDAAFGVEQAIIARGLVIDYVSHTGEMLARTGADVGSDVELFAQADVFLFCSASLSRKVMEADPMNIMHCPYGIFVAERAGEVMIGYRPYPEGPMQEVQALLDEIVQDAVAF